jgi:predicted membrane protein
MVAGGGGERVTLRPLQQLFGQGLIAVVAFMTPVFVVLYVMTIPAGPWRAVLVTQIIATIAVVLAALSYFRAAIRVDPTSITEVGFFGRTRRVEAREIGSVFVADVFEASGTKTLPQLFVRDLQGRQVIRMRGQFWSRESMDTVLATLDVPKLARDDSVSTRELRDEYPGLLYWFERRPVIAALAFTAGTAIVGSLIYLLFVVSGWT